MYRHALIFPAMANNIAEEILKLESKAVVIVTLNPELIINNKMKINIRETLSMSKV